jgi:BA14K-like protein
MRSKWAVCFEQHTSTKFAVVLLAALFQPTSSCLLVRVSGVVMLLLAAALICLFVTVSSEPVQGASAEPSRAPMPQLVVHARGIAGDPVSLGLEIQGSADGGLVVITGLLPGMTLSNGKAVDADMWQVPATDLANTWVGPPTGFVGIVDLVAELHLADMSVVHRQPIRIEWVATSPAAAEQAATVMPSADAGPVPPSLQQNEIAKDVESATATIKQHGGRTHQKRVASKNTVPISNKIQVKVPPGRRAGHAPAYTGQQHREQPSQPMQTADDNNAARVSDESQGILGLLLPRRRSVPISENTDSTDQDGTSVAAVPGDKATQEAKESAPTHRNQNECDHQACASAYRSFRASDCTYQPHGGRRRLCEKGTREIVLPERTSQVSTVTRSQQCNREVCARFYKSFDPSDCTYQPNSGGARKICDR